MISPGEYRTSFRAGEDHLSNLSGRLASFTIFGRYVSGVHRLAAIQSRGGQERPQESRSEVLLFGISETRIRYDSGIPVQ